eukprot:2726293-Pleurochrysis_carterae.AAC.1
MNETGSEGRYGKFVSKYATFRPIRTRGAGLAQLPSHINAIHESWILRYSPPIEAQWKQVLDYKWISMPRYALLHLSNSEQQQLLQQIEIPHGRHLII